MADSLQSFSLWPWTRALVLGVAFCSLLGGRCRVDNDDDDHFCDDDDFHRQCDDDFDDDDFHDDDVVIIIRSDGEPVDPWRLDHHRSELDPGTGARRYFEIVGVSIFDALGPGDYAVEDFAGFAGVVWERNRDRLGPPYEGAEIRLHSVRAVEDRVLVVFRQLDGAGWELRPAAELRFHFDTLGHLVEVEDETRAIP